MLISREELWPILIWHKSYIKIKNSQKLFIFYKMYIPNNQTQIYDAGNFSLALQPLIYDQQHNNSHTLWDAIGRACILINYIILFPILAFCLSKFLKYLRTNNVVHQNDREVDEIMNNVRISAASSLTTIPPSKNEKRVHF